MDAVALVLSSPPLLVEFVIPGKAVAWQRARLHNGIQFTAKETRAYQNLVKLAAQEQMGQAPIIDGPIALDVTVTFSVPQSWSKTKAAEALYGHVMPTGRPDLDNVLKSIKDGLRAVVYRDDAQVCRLMAWKEYGPKAQVRVLVTKLMARGAK